MDPPGDPISQTSQQEDPVMQKLRTARAKAKQGVTKQVNRINRLVVTDELANITDEIEMLKKEFEKFEIAHNDYYENVDDDDEIDKCDVYYDDVQTNFVKMLGLVKSVMISDENVSKESDVAKLVDILRLPDAHVLTFAGDPTEYHNFIRSFEINVDSRSKDSDKKLTHLLKYTSGPAHSAIKGCILIGGDEGYKQALKILKQRFGNAHLVTDRIVQNLRYGNSVRTEAEILQLSDDVSNAILVLKQLNMLSEVSSQAMIVDVVYRLPQFIQNKWCKNATKIKRQTEVYPTFENFSEFLNDIAHDSSDPVYGVNFRRRQRDTKHVTHTVHTMPVASDETPGGGAGSRSAEQVSNAAASSYHDSYNSGKQNQGYSWQEPVCFKCGKERHRLWNCTDFKAMTPRERFDFVSGNNLCKNCLLASHDTDSCRKQSVCSVQGCGLKHTKYIHIDDPCSNVAVADATGASCFNTCSKTALMPILEITVNGIERVHCLLDTASSNTFCTKSLVEKLGINGTVENVTVETLTDSKTIETELVDLSISSSNGVTVDMSKVYLTDRIPVRTGYIDADEYKHLRGLTFPNTKDIEKVDLLIGLDYSDLLLPNEIRRGKSGEPFAISTKLGWCINGSIPANVITHVVNSFATSVSTNGLKCESLSLNATDDDETVSNIITEGVFEINELKIRQNMFDAETSGDEERVLDPAPSHMTNHASELPLKIPRYESPNMLTQGQRSDTIKINCTDKDDHVKNCVCYKNIIAKAFLMLLVILTCGIASDTGFTIFDTGFMSSPHGVTSFCTCYVDSQKLISYVERNIYWCRCIFGAWGAWKMSKLGNLVSHDFSRLVDTSVMTLTYVLTSSDTHEIYRSKKQLQDIVISDSATLGRHKSCRAYSGS